MDTLFILEPLLTAIVVAPGVLFLAIATLWLLGWTPPERFIARTAAALYSAMAAAVVVLCVLMLRAGQDSLYVMHGAWFRVGEYSFPLLIFVDRLSLPLILLTVALVGITGSFSVRYLHRDVGFLRFFLLMHLFAFGALLVFTAGSYDLLLGGWELVGFTSVFLIGFFTGRREPVRNAIRVFATYRIADLGLMTAVFVLHHSAGSALYPTLFQGVWPAQTSALNTGAATLAGLLLLLGASGKSAQVPFSGWLPRAMEGPTPSSAIFYGAISVHIGAYLLLRSEPVLRQAPFAAAAVVLVGCATALLGTLAHRTSNDVKTSLAYAAMTQLGVIFMEIGFGFTWLALLHIVGHACVRTMQFLRAPSLLHDHHGLHAAAGGHLEPTGLHWEKLVPAPARAWLYRAGLERGFLDSLTDRFLIEPGLNLAWILLYFERPARPAESDPAPATRPATETR